jgi:hypothetical protein
MLVVDFELEHDCALFTVGMHALTLIFHDVIIDVIRDKRDQSTSVGKEFIMQD